MSTKVFPINPKSLGAPRGYANGMISAPGARILFIAGQVAWDENQQIVSNGFADQFGQALKNVVAVVAAAGGEPENIGSLTIYVVDHMEYLEEIKEVGKSYRSIMGKHFPAMALVEVSALLEPGAKIEIQGIAAL